PRLMRCSSNVTWPARSLNLRSKYASASSGVPSGHWPTARSASPSRTPTVPGASTRPHGVSLLFVKASPCRRGRPPVADRQQAYCTTAPGQSVDVEGGNRRGNDRGTVVLGTARHDARIRDLGGKRLEAVG